jgi:hypothetical protein
VVGVKDSDPKGFVEHWNGRYWSIVAKLLRASGVAALSPREVWVTGDQIGHWNGKNWRISRVPKEGHLLDVDTLSANDVWAGGRTSSDSLLLSHWNGSRWVAARIPRIRGVYSEAWDIATVSHTNVWAVGYRDTGATATSGAPIDKSILLRYGCS